MATKIKINGSTLVPLKEAAKKISYSRDYLARLARDKKIVATQVGRQWFVDMESVNIFLEGIALEQVVRKQHLSEERKHERLMKIDLQSLNEKIKQKTSAFHQRSLLVATLVLCLGLFSGSVIYTKTNLTKSVLNNNIVASTFTPQKIDEKIVFMEVNDTSFSEVEYPLFVDESEVRAMTTSPEGIFIFGREGETGNQTEVTNLFSDPVSIVFTDDNSGIIKYKNDDKKVTEFPFVSVPVGNEKEKVVIESSS